jgi:hypothetical protein
MHNTQMNVWLKGLGLYLAIGVAVLAIVLLVDLYNTKNGQGEDSLPWPVMLAIVLLYPFLLLVYMYERVRGLK